MGDTKLGAESARRVLQLLFAFEENAPTRSARELASATGIPLPSVQRYLALLRNERLVLEAAPRRYRLSPRVFALARASEAAEPLVVLADPVMRALAQETAETVLLVQLVGGAAVCTHRIESPQRIRLSYEPGQELPLTAGASARLLLAGVEPGLRRRYLEAQGATDLEQHLAAIEEVKRRGWATSFGEIDEGIWAAAAAVIDNGKVASLSLPCPVFRAPPDRRVELLDAVRRAAALLNQRLAERGAPPRSGG